MSSTRQRLENSAIKRSGGEDQDSATLMKRLEQQRKKKRDLKMRQEAMKAEV